MILVSTVRSIFYGVFFVLFFQSVVDIPGMNLGSADYYPYIYYKINLDLTEAIRL
jgi:hypothetical protein